MRTSWNQNAAKWLAFSELFDVQLADLEVMLKIQQHLAVHIYLGIRTIQQASWHTTNANDMCEDESVNAPAHFPQFQCESEMNSTGKREAEKLGSIHTADGWH